MPRFSIGVRVLKELLDYRFRSCLSVWAPYSSNWPCVNSQLFAPDSENLNRLKSGTAAKTAQHTALHRKHRHVTYHLRLLDDTFEHVFISLRLFRPCHTPRHHLLASFSAALIDFIRFYGRNTFRSNSHVRLETCDACFTNMGCLPVVLAIHLSFLALEHAATRQDVRQHCMLLLLVYALREKSAAPYIPRMCGHPRAWRKPAFARGTER